MGELWDGMKRHKRQVMGVLSGFLLLGQYTMTKSNMR